MQPFESPRRIFSIRNNIRTPDGEIISSPSPTIVPFAQTRLIFSDEEKTPRTDSLRDDEKIVRLRKCLLRAKQQIVKLKQNVWFFKIIYSCIGDKLQTSNRANEEGNTK